MPTPPQPESEPGAEIPVRYYPRRIRRPAQPARLSPAQALHLARDPARAEQARRTAEHHCFVPPPASTPPAAVPIVEPAAAEPEAAPTPRGALRRFFSRLLRRH